MVSNASQTYIGYLANINVIDAVAGADSGYLTADAKILTTQTGPIYLGDITSELNGKRLTLMAPDRLAAAVQNS